MNSFYHEIGINAKKVVFTPDFGCFHSSFWVFSPWKLDFVPNRFNSWIGFVA